MLEIIKDKEKSLNTSNCYGLKDEKAKALIIPCHYPKKQLEKITSYTKLKNGVYLLEGRKDNLKIFGLYNSLLDDFLSLEYDKVTIQKNKIILEKTLKEELFYDTLTGYKVNLLKEKVHFVSDEDNPNLFGVEDKVTGEAIIPYKYKLVELEDIESYEKLDFQGIYLLKNKNQKIVGIYDSINDKLIKSLNTSYEIINEMLILKNKINVGSGINANKQIVNTLSYISLYNPKTQTFITDLKYASENGEELNHNFSSKYQMEALKCQNNLFFLKYHGEFFRQYLVDIYDPKTNLISQNFRDDYTFLTNDKLKLYDMNKNRPVVYDINTSSFLEYQETPIKGLYVNLNSPCKYIYELLYNSKYEVKEFPDFNIILENNHAILLFTNDFQTIIEPKGLEKIENIKCYSPLEQKELGFFTSTSKFVYLIDKELYTFEKRKYPFNQSYFPFVKIPKMITYIESDYGIKMLEASSLIELDYKLEQLEKLQEEMKKLYENNEDLQEKYPKLIKRK